MNMPHPDNEPKSGSASPPLENLEERELVRLNRVLRTLSEGNRALLRMSDEQGLLQEMCQVIVHTGGYASACVAYTMHDEAKGVRWVAGAGTDLARLNALGITWADTEVGRNNVVGVAIRSGRPEVGKRPDDAMYAGQAFDHLRAFSTEQGFASFTVFPLSVEGQVLGVLAIAATEPDAFDESEVKLLNELSDDLAYGISNLRIRVQNLERQATIARLAYYDELTGLPNRALLLETLTEAIERARQECRPLALLQLEVGHFREINKVLGYRAGDELLQALGGRLSKELHGDETLARLAEAEFALLLPNASAEHAINVAQHLLHALLAPFDIADLLIDARVRIGIALFPGHASNAEFLIRRANVAMHQEKSAHGAYAMYSGGQEQEYTRRLSLMGDLYHAIKNNELRLYCQPKVDIASRQVYGAEALVRWQHPQHGSVPTSEFIRLAEEAGTITPLTNWMLEATFSQVYAWQEAGMKWALAINLSGHDLYDAGLIERIRGLFSTWGIPPELIQFELTESTLMADPVASLETLNRLKQLGVKLFVDDYGTGYSSLSYLQKLPVDGVKIDQSFVAPMIKSRDSAMIVSSTIELSHNLGLQVVAEGVESQAIWDCLAKLRCDVAQGYLISRAMPAGQCQTWNRQWIGATS